MNHGNRFVSADLLQYRSEPGGQVCRLNLHGIIVLSQKGSDSVALKPPQSSGGDGNPQDDKGTHHQVPGTVGLGHKRRFLNEQTLEALTMRPHVTGNSVTWGSEIWQVIR